MANALGQDALQATPDGQSLVNVISDSCGRLLVVSASSNSGSGGSTAISPSSTWTVTTSTSSIVGLTTTSVISYSSIPTVALSTTSVIGTTTTSTISLTTTSLVGLSSGTQTIGTLSTTQVVTLTTTSVVGLTTTSLVALTSSALTIGVLSTTQVSTVVNSSGIQQIGTVALTSGSAIPLSTVGTVTAVGLTCSNAVAQAVIGANLNRKGLMIVNSAASAVAFLNFSSTSIISSTAAGGYSLTLAAGASYVTPAGGVVFAGGITGNSNLLTGCTVAVTEWT